MTIKTMTFNLRTHVPSDGKNAWPYRDEIVVQTIKSNEPLILGVQEGLHEMVTKLQYSLPDYQMIGEGRGGGEFDEYNAVFYNREVLSLTNDGQFWLSETPEVVNSRSWKSDCPRICTWGEFEFKNDSSRQFAFFNTHLDHISQEAREKGSQLIGTKIEPYITQNIPVILTGDFNVKPDNKVMQILEDAHLFRVHTEGRTFHDFKGGIDGEPIDYIFISKHLKAQHAKVERYSVGGAYPSDHYPVLADLIEST